MRIVKYILGLFKKEQPKPTRFNVRITSCAGLCFWYRKRIGEVYLVEESPDGKQYLTIETNIMGNSRGYINKDECMIVHSGESGLPTK